MNEYDMDDIGYDTQDYSPGDIVYVLGQGVRFVAVRKGRTAPQTVQHYNLCGEMRVVAIRNRALQVEEIIEGQKPLTGDLYTVMNSSCIPLSIQNRYPTPD